MRMEIIQKSNNIKTNLYVNHRDITKKNVLYEPEALLIECKNKLDINDHASSYKLALMLNMPQIIPTCIEGEGLAPFVDALFIAKLHLKTGTTDVFIGTTDPANRTRCEFIQVRTHKNNSLHSENMLLQPYNTQSEINEQYVHDWALVLKKKDGCHQNSLNNGLPILKREYDSVYVFLKFINDHQLIQNCKYGSIHI